MSSIRPRLLLAITLIALPVGANAQIDNYRPYHALLARQCSARHLEWLSAADLDEQMEAFHDSLRQSAQQKLDRANDQKTACAHVIAGLTCFNVAGLLAMNETGLLARFAKTVCASGLECRAQSDCSPGVAK